jgi:hypothetical protein
MRLEILESRGEDREEEEEVVVASRCRERLSSIERGTSVWLAWVKLFRSCRLGWGAYLVMRITPVQGGRIGIGLTGGHVAQHVAVARVSGLTVSQALGA